MIHWVLNCLASPHVSYIFGSAAAKQWWFFLIAVAMAKPSPWTQSGDPDYEEQAAAQRFPPAPGDDYWYIDLIWWA